MDLKRHCIVVMAALSSVGCASTIESAASKASEAAVQEALRELTAAQAGREPRDGEPSEPPEEEAQAEPAAEAQAEPAAEDEDAAAPALGFPEPSQGRVQSGAADLSAQISRGVLATLESERARRRIASITEAATRAALAQTLETLDEPVAQQQVAELSRQVASAAAEEMTETLAAEEAQGALDRAARSASHHAVLGMAAGLGDVWRSDAIDFWNWLWLPLALLALVCLALVAGAVIAVARARRSRAELARLERAALLLATAVRQGHRGDGDPERDRDSEELAAMIQRALGARPSTTGGRLRDSESAG